MSTTGDVIIENTTDCSFQVIYSQLERNYYFDSGHIVSLPDYKIAGKEVESVVLCGFTVAISDMDNYHIF